jgi:hypothetical protein
MNHQPELPMVATASEADAEQAEADKDQKEDYEMPALLRKQRRVAAGS